MQLKLLLKTEEMLLLLCDASISSVYLNWIHEQQGGKDKEDRQNEDSKIPRGVVKTLPHTNTLLNTDQGFVSHVGEC